MGKPVSGTVRLLRVAHLSGDEQIVITTSLIPRFPKSGRARLTDAPQPEEAWSSPSQTPL